MFKDARVRDRWALAGLLAATAVLYVWGLNASGWANSFYSAAVQAGSQSWKAFFFGSSDAANAITVDKTPASLWPMELSARIFGLNSWSILVPQALMGVATVGVVYAAVRRRFPAWAALLGGAVMAVTPVAVLMFRFNNPDALLVLLLTVAGYCVVRAQEKAGTRWLVLAGACIGFAFLAKMLQAFVVLPGFALVYLITAPTTIGRRLWQLALAGGAMLVSAGWWLVAVALVPAADRPYIGGSQTNSVLELALGYNGIGRLNGGDYGGLGNLNQEAGWLRMFDTEAGGQISWLLPAALVLLVAAIWLTRSAPRTDPVRAQVGVWGSWLVVTGLIFSLMQGIFHAYYTVALAPAIAVLVGSGAALLWERRENRVLALAAAVTAGWAYVLLSRSSEWNSWLGPVVLVAGLAAAVGLLVVERYQTGPAGVPSEGSAGMPSEGLAGASSAGLVSAPSGGTAAVSAEGPERVLSAGPAGESSAGSAWVLSAGSAGAPSADPAGVPSERPAEVLSRGPVGVPSEVLSRGLEGASSEGPGAVRSEGSGGVAIAGRGWWSRRLSGIVAAVAVVVCLAGPAAYALDTAASAHTGAIPTAGPSTGGFGGPGGFRGGGGGPAAMGPGGFGGGGQPGVAGRGGQQGVTGQPGGTGGNARSDGMGDGGFARGGRGGGMGGLLQSATPSAELTALLKTNASAYDWVAAAIGSNNAAGYQLAAGQPVMAVGGFNGTDPAPTLAQFKQYVAEGKIHYFIGGGMGGGMGGMRGGAGTGGTGGSSDATEIAAWVQETFTASTVGNTTLYDLTAAK
ncbi:glycosyltransferase family 39 protein [Nonomuraea sp. NEAU-A123]|uniref:ArnT family glycosyltransferase n=1 Tax=Nonomuraea sp. NEAU-A123 TaxID=2839649 RepID=UPI0027E15722|nr:glycosyltransferase family 39 protein [Nonomuraea sp. NEAU-A123]